MDKNVVKMAKQRAKNYRKALKYLDGLKAFTLNDFFKVLSIAGVDMSDSEIRQTWEQSSATIYGPEGLRKIYRETLLEGITTFEQIASS